MNDPLIDALHRCLPAAGHDTAALDLQRLPDTGLAHDHVRLVGRGLLARVPKQSQMGLGAAQNLAYQAACFTRAAASGHTPVLHGVLPPQPDHPALARGALLVQEIAGRPLPLPDGLPALVDALAALHRLPLPPTTTRAPLQDPADPLAALAAEIEAQVTHLPAAALAPGSRRGIDAALADWRRTLAAPARPPKRLISFDAHPGNFLLQADGRAVLVDLEKARYGPPPLDLAHATLYTSTTWDIASHADLPLAAVRDAQRHWLQAVGDPELWHPWLLPLRNAMWLWAVTWCAKWRVQSAAARSTQANGEDWSAERSDPALVAHVRGRVDHYLSPAGVARVLDELSALRQQS